MRLSTRTRYGTRALIEIARCHGTRSVKRREIAQAQGLTPGYLENILVALKTQKFVHPTRGAGGGFVLGRPPAEISLFDIVNALEGSIAPVDCVDNPGSCSRSRACGARIAWVRLHDAQKKALASLSLADLVEMDGGTGRIDFTI